MRTRSLLSLIAIGLLHAGLLHASEPVASPATDAASCVEVEVDGVRTPSYNCLSQKLQPKATPNSATPPQMGSEAIVQRPSNQLGLFNRAATSNRMGNTFGTSVYPQRPPAKP
ncbi:Uncharacterized conserved protein [Janthinobacterium sp. Marseille]|nr:hypothetical protein [Janthinobacterium sp. Marseille]ABR91283.1 Uncharacterized conserved protein [Janthinobacterium sp. Marseille]